MGKAAARSARRRKNFLVTLSHENISRFDREWENRLDGWLLEIRRRRIEWEEGGMAARKLIFAVADRVMEILSNCSREARLRHEQTTSELLYHACSVQVAEVVDKRLYRLNKLNPELLKAKTQGPS